MHTCVFAWMCVYACVCEPVDDARPRMTHLSNEMCAVRSGAAKRSSAAATMRAELSPTSATRRAPSRAPKLRRAYAHTRTHARTHACTRAERFVERRIEGRARVRACQQLEGHHAYALALACTDAHTRTCARVRAQGFSASGARTFRAWQRPPALCSVRSPAQRRPPTASVVQGHRLPPH